jgi:1-acyl-sn-glycerol-3-phosphate acyltransferase
VSRVRDVIVSVFVWGASIALLIGALPLLLILRIATAPFDPSRRFVGRMFHGVGRFLVAIHPSWDFRVDVPESVRAAFREPSVLVLNHESDADVFLAACLPWDAKFLSKDALYDLPVMGWAMRLAGDVGVVRGDRESGSEARAELADWIERGISIVVFPEGTRSRTAEMLPFKEGAFRIAIEAGVPVQPVAIAGTADALAPGGWILRPARAIARALPPVSTAGLGLDAVPALAERVREDVKRVRDELRVELAPPGSRPLD